MSRCLQCGRRMWVWQRQTIVTEGFVDGPMLDVRLHFRCAVKWLRTWLATAKGPLKVTYR